MDDLLALAAPALAPLGSLGVVTAILVWLIRAVGTGKLIPGAIHDRMIAALTDRIDAQAEIIGQLVGQQDRMLETGETTTHLLQSLGGDQP